MTELERELRGLAAAIAFPETPEIAANLRLAPRAERLPRPRRSWRTAAVVVAVVLAVAVAAGLAVPQARTSILHWFGIGEVRIEFVDRLPEVRPDAPARPRHRDRLRRRAVPAAPARRPRQARRHLSLGRRRHVAVRHPGAGRALSSRRSRTRASRPSSARSSLEAGTRVEFVPIRGSAGPALWITGEPHVVLLPGGPARLAANTLIWTRGRLTIRLEGAETLQQARAIAESFG